jgi:exodeoxyribonuclease VII small subunit
MSHANEPGKAPAGDPGRPEAAPLAFEEALQRLEAIVRELEEGRLGLSESLGRYEEGIRCLRHCYQLLNEAEEKIELLTGVDAEGNSRTEPFDEEQMSLEERAKSRGRRRSKKPRKPAANADSSEDAGDVDAPDSLF